MIVKILIGLAVLLAVFVVVVATRPAAYKVERSADVAAPPGAVFASLNDLHRFAAILFLFGEPFEKAQAEKTFGGPDAGGPGQTLTWKGKDTGAGTLTVAESVPGQKVALALEFTEPMASKAAWVLSLSPGPNAGTHVTWTMTGDHNFVGKAFGLFANMDQMMGADLEKGLAVLGQRR